MWIFRIASTPEAGGGHIMRALSIARELSKYQSVHFLLCEGGEYWIERINKYNISASIYHHTNEIKDKKLLIDGYHFSESELLEWGRQCKFISFIDDNNKAPIYADLIISTSMDKLQSCDNKKILIQGSKYALLAPEYGISSNTNRTNSMKKVKNILISCGLRDSNNYSLQTLDTLSACNFDGKVVVAIGSQSPHLKSLLSVKEKYDFIVEVVLDSDGLHELMKKTDMVIGAGGVSLLERMALGKPSVTIIAAENQRNQADWAETIGATINADPLKSEFKTDMIRAINLLLNQKEKRVEMGYRGMNTIDGKGSKRVAKCMAFGEC